MIATSLLAVTPAMRDKSYGPAIFVGLLVVGLGVMWYFRRAGVRRALAVYATAALWAMMRERMADTDSAVRTRLGTRLVRAADQRHSRAGPCSRTVQRGVCGIRAALS